MTTDRRVSDDGGTGFGWVRAAVTTAALLAVVVLVLVIVPNAILTNLDALDRSGRVGVATAWFSVALVGLAFALRRLQARHLL